MTLNDIILFVGIAALAIFTQVGRRPITLRRFLIPIAAVGYAAFHYLQTIPTVGGDLDFEAALTLVGLAFGLLAAYAVRVERDADSGRIVMQAGLAYATIWIVAFGGRLAFDWAAHNVWRHAVAQFSIQHAITGSDAWTAGFVLMAIAMVAARTLVLGVRAALVARSGSALQPVAG